MRIVFVTQQVDPAHPALAATVPMLRALAERVDEVVVLADRALPGVLPDNCRVRPFAARSQAGRGLRFESALAAELAHRPKPAALVAHMCPIYAVLAAPLARPLGTKVLLWYTHWSVSRTLQAAERVSNVVLTVDRRTFPLDSPKVRAIGHGIDLSEFPCADGVGGAVPTCARSRSAATRRRRGSTSSCGRSGSPSTAASTCGWRSYGPALNPDERAHRAELERLVEELDLGRRVKLGHAVLRSEVPGLFARADVLVNNMRAGSDRQGRLRGMRELHARDRVEPRVRRAAARRAPLRPRRCRCSRRPAARARRRVARAAPGARPHPARARRRLALGRIVGGRGRRGSRLSAAAT